MPTEVKWYLAARGQQQGPYAASQMETIFGVGSATSQKSAFLGKLLSDGDR